MQMKPMLVVTPLRYNMFDSENLEKWNLLTPTRTKGYG